MTQSTSLVRTLVVALCLLAGWAYLARSSRAETLPARDPLAELPLGLESWNGRNEQPFDQEILDVLGVDDYIVRSYFRPGAAVGLYIGYYFTQRQGDTIHSPLNCLPGAGWQPLEIGRATVEVAGTAGQSGTRPIEVNRVVIGKGLDRQLVLYWYQSRDRVVASEYWGKIYTVLDAVEFNRTDAALVRVIVPIPDQGSVDKAESEAIAFVQAMFPYLGRHLPA
jgi:EpsI family protein